jgi:copper transport protein
MAVTQAGALVVAAVGAVLLLVVDELELAAAGTAVDPVAYVAGNRIGIILALRAAIPLIGGASLLIWLRRGPAGADGGARAGATVALGSVAAVSALGLTAISGHAAAFASPVPAMVDLVHLGAASVWFGGLVGLAGLVGGPAPPSRDALQEMIPRFSGLALVSVAVLGLTGLYAAWISTEDWTRIGAPYAFGLAVKVVVVGSAFAIGGLTYLDRGRDLPLVGGTPRRLGIEAALAMLVLVATASLTALEPPAPTRPVTIAPADVEGPVLLSIAPGRAGPGLLVVGGPVPVGARVDLVPLAGPGADRGLAADGGPGADVGDRVPIALDLRSLGGVAGIAAERARVELGAHVGGTVVLPAGRWEATVGLAPGAAPVARFVFAVDESGVTEGRLAPALPPPLVAGAGLLVLAIMAGVAAARGTALPNVERASGRAALAGFALVAGPLGAAILILGPPG